MRVSTTKCVSRTKGTADYHNKGVASYLLGASKLGAAS